jgi:Bacteriophage HK97-gp10, putative tail-component
MQLQVKIDGMTEAVAQLHGLKRGFRNRILRKALKAGGNVIRDLAKAGVKRGPARGGKHLGTSIKTVVTTAKASGSVTAFVQSSAPHAVLVEKGHKGPRAGVSRRGPTKARALIIRDAGGAVIAFRRSTRDVAGVHYMQHAIDQGAPKCVQEIKRVVDEELGKVKSKDAIGWAA